jgi:hypothetical protein
VPDSVRETKPAIAAMHPSVRQTENPGKWLLCLGAVLISYLILEFLLPMRTAVQIGGDEGFELAKATLCLKGFRPYEQVWNDQPPLHTAMITALLRLQFNIQDSKFKASEDSNNQPSSSSQASIQNPESRIQNSPSVPRLVSVFFGAVLIASLFSMAHRVHGLAAAVVASVILISSPGFLGLSASCMLEVPSLATALAAMAVLVAPNCGGERNREIYQILEKGTGSGGAESGTTPSAVFLSRGLPVDNTHTWRVSRLHSIPSLVVAAGVFGCAVMMKLVPLMLLPLFALIFLLSAYSALSTSVSSSVPSAKSVVKNSLFRLFIFGLTSAVTFILLDLLFDRGAFLRHFTQTWTSHFGPQRSFEYGSAADHPFDWSLLWKHWDATLPALAALVLILAAGSFSGRWRFDFRISLFPFAWLFYSLFIFILHRPWWPYYYVHIAVPLSWCAAIGLLHLFRIVADNAPPAEAAFKRRGLSRPKHRPSVNPASSTVQRSSDSTPATSSSLRRLGVGIFFLCALAWSVGRVYLQIAEVRRAPKIQTDLAIAEIARYQPFTEFLYADEPIYSFHTGIPMPPDLAVIMYKRLWSGDMTNEKITAELTATKPGLILLKNDTRLVPYKSLLQTEYRLVYYDSAHRLYAHKSISRKRLGY